MPYHFFRLYSLAFAQTLKLLNKFARTIINDRKTCTQENPLYILLYFRLSQSNCIACIHFSVHSLGKLVRILTKLSQPEKMPISATRRLFRIAAYGKLLRSFSTVPLFRDLGYGLRLGESFFSPGKKFAKIKELDDIFVYFV